MALRWGIVSAGKISHDFVNDLNILSKDDHKVIAISARDLNRANKFAEIHKIPNFYGSYEELAKNVDVDVVYIGTVNSEHYDAAMLMLNHGKHVLCETPLCLNEKQAKKLINFAKEKKLFLMEALWSRFLPAYRYLRKQIDDGVLGDIKEVKVSFGVDFKHFDRLIIRSLGGGCLLDLGNFIIQFSQWIFRTPPAEIKATGKLNEDGCDVSVNAELIYPGGGRTILATSAEELLENNAVITGTKGTMTLDSCWNTQKLTEVDGKEKVFECERGQHEMNFPGSMGMRFQAEEVRKCIRDGKVESDIVSHDEILIIARIEDEIRKQIGYVFDHEM